MLLGGVELTEFLQKLPELVGMKPRSILLVSAHYIEEEGVAVTSGEQPELVYDYQGFPRETYKYKYPASGDPALASNVASMLQKRGIKCKKDPEGRWDHGVFVPLMLAYPVADIPVVSLSLNQSLDPRLHYEIGQALAPLREEGVLIVSSGMSFHNMRAFSFRSSSSVLKGEQFDTDLTRACMIPNEAERKQALIQWKSFREATFAHPTDEHLIPLMVAAGASGNDKGEVAHSGSFAGTKISSIIFGKL